MDNENKIYVFRERCLYRPTIGQRKQMMSFYRFKCITPLTTIFQLYRVTVSFIGGGSGENHRPVASH